MSDMPRTDDLLCGLKKLTEQEMFDKRERVYRDKGLLDDEGNIISINDKLPTDVPYSLGGTVRKGCSYSTLIMCLWRQIGYFIRTETELSQAKALLIECEEAFNKIRLLEDSYDTEQEVLGEIFLTCETMENKIIGLSDNPIGDV